MGTYTDIIHVYGPSEAAPGETVDLTVIVQNIHSGGMYAAVTAAFDGISLQSTPADAVIPAGGTASFNLNQFIMPNKTISGEVVSWYWGTDQQWHKDDVRPTVISLEGAPPVEEYDGDIENIRVNGSAIPQTLPYGEGFRIQFTGRNRSTVNVKLWASVDVYRPNGQRAYHGEDAESYPYTNPGGTHDFQFPSWPSSVAVDDEGDWKATIELRVSSASGTLLDRKTSLHIITVPVEEEPEPEYNGEIANVQVRSGVNNFSSILPHQLEMGQGYSVAFRAINQSTIPLVLRGEILITKPGGGTDSDDDFTGTSFPYWESPVNPGNDHTFRWNAYPLPHRFTASEIGEYSASLVLKGKKPGEPDSLYEQLAVWEDTIVVAGEAEGPPTNGEPAPDVYEGKITDIAVDWSDLPGGEIPIEGLVNAPVGEHIRISFEGWNMTGPLMRLRAELWLYAPDGRLTYHDDDTSTLPYSAGSSHTFIFPKPPFAMSNPIDMIGQWKLKIQLTDKDNIYLLAEYADEEGNPEDAFGAEQPPTGTWDVIGSMIPLMMMVMMMGMIMPMTQQMGAGGE